MRRFPLGAWAFLLIGATAAAACGDSGSSETNGTSGSAGAGGGDASVAGAGGASGSGATGGTGGGTGGASGSSAGGSAGTAGGAGASGAGGGWPGGGFGDPCTLFTDCRSQLCVDVGQAAPNLICSQGCVDGSPCPSGAYCAFVTGAYVCVPDSGSQCAPCSVDTDCPGAGDRCVRGPMGDTFCARDCGFDGACPSGNTCVTPDTIGLPPQGDADAGASRPEGLCVPEASGSCPCEARRDGQTRTCSQVVGGLTCQGVETCNAGASAFEGCTAGTPSPEVCDGLDNDCSGTADDADPSVLCAAAGAPAGVTLGCDGATATCFVAGCPAGFAHYPTSLPLSAACACPVDATEPNDDCSAPTAGGTIYDGDGAGTPTAVVINGRLTSDTDVDWYRVETRDEGGASGVQSYHVEIDFVAPLTNNEFEFDVIRGGVCGAPDPSRSALATYTWCVDGTSADPTQGAYACGGAGTPQCGGLDTAYLIRVKRKSGAVGSCDGYSLRVRARGDAPGTCQFATQCDP